MNCKAVWKEGMTFKGRVGKHTVTMDASAPLGHDHGPTPKELVALGLVGCTGMDVVGLLHKYHQKLDFLEVETKIEQTTHGYPIVFKEIEIIFHMQGEVDSKMALEAVNLSQTKYCGVNAMLDAFAPIKWRVVLNGKDVGRGEAEYCATLE